MRIGISIMTGGTQNVWNNGLVQNIYHLATLMEAIPFVERVFLLNCGAVNEHPPGTDEIGKNIPLIPLNEASDHIDVVIEQGGAIDPEWSRRFRARGGKVVLHICGQPYASLIEPTVFNRQGFFVDPERFDEVWLLAKDVVFAGMIGTIHRCPVYEVPYLWSPRFLDRTIMRDASGAPTFGYRPGSLARGSVRPAIFEPNISPFKMGLIPMLICDTIERRNPGLIGRVNLMNSLMMSEQRGFVAFMQNLDLYRAGKVEIANRDYFAHVMGRGANLVVSHQITWSQNYLYLDALHGGYPLVHNSPFFRDFGYYYEGSDVEAGAAALSRAVTDHDRNLDAYRRNGMVAIEYLSPTRRANIDNYARRLVSLSHDRGCWRAA